MDDKPTSLLYRNHLLQAAGVKPEDVVEKLHEDLRISDNKANPFIFGAMGE